MRVLIAGGDGMLGHRLLRQFAPRHDARVTLRQPLEAYRAFGLFDGTNAYDATDVRDVGRIQRVLSEFRPEAIVNAAGVIKQRADAEDGVLSIEVNSFFPHLLARMCRAAGARLIHVSTDCVFSGGKGNYAETDRPDPVDTYGFSKLLGEVDSPGTLTLRTSMIGTELARIIERLLIAYPGASGLYHVSSAAISKLDLLSALERKLKLGVRIVPDDEVVCDRSLESTRFRSEFGYRPPTWDAMLDELAAEIGA